jgi:hypothetical protein
MLTPRDAEPDWIEKDQNPFHLRICDCRPFTRTMVSTTSDPAIAARFASLRNQDGRHNHDASLPDAIWVPCHVQYSAPVNLRDGPVFRARAMEEKWDVDFYAGKLYFSRSWTGSLELVGLADKNSATLAISAVHAAAATREGRETMVRDVDFLVKTYIFDREVPHCLPSNLPATEKSIIVYSFSRFGRAASYATYEDTTRVAV